MAARFHAPDARAPGQDVALPTEEAQHLTRVLRLVTGDEVRVFDGRGHEFDGVVRHAGKDGVMVAIGAARTPSATEPSVAITLAQAVLKGDKMDDVVRDAVMLGAAAIQPVVTARSEISLASLARSHRRDRWERIAIASAKQCGRAVVPMVMEPCSFQTLLERPAPIVAAAADPIGDPAERHAISPTTQMLMCVEPSAKAEVATIASLDPRPPSAAWLIIGPEGGWTTEELHLAAGTYQLVQLGTRTLRADTAPLVALSALLTIWREL